MHKNDISFGLTDRILGNTLGVIKECSKVDIPGIAVAARCIENHHRLDTTTVLYIRSRSQGWMGRVRDKTTRFHQRHVFFGQGTLGSTMTITWQITSIGSEVNTHDLGQKRPKGVKDGETTKSQVSISIKSCNIFENVIY